MAEPILTPLNGSTNGRGILVVATGTPGTLVHTVSTAGSDRVFIYAQNNHTSTVLLTIEFGGVTSPNDIIQQTLPSKSGLVPIITGQCLDGGVVIRAFAASASVVSLFGGVSRN